MTADKDALLPCPLCGASAEKPKKVGGSDERNGYNFDVVITCKCGLSISRKSRHDKQGWCNDTGQAQSDVIQAWNRRITAVLAEKDDDDVVKVIRRKDIAGNEHHEHGCTYQCCGFYSPCRGICATPLPKGDK